MKNEIRKLAAILFADIQGYTAMMQTDDERAFLLVEKFKKEVNHCVSSNNGSVVQFYGDGVLVLFDSAGDAVQCALDLQKQFLKDPVVPVRIGLNDGEVLLKDGNAFGDSINIASRIESIGTPGSILFSGSIYDQIHNKKKFTSQLIGRFHFKNVNREIDVYALANDNLPIPDKNKVSGKLKEKKQFGRRQLLISGLIAVIFMVVLSWILTRFSRTAAEPEYGSWLGNWSQSVEGSGDPIKGIISFMDKDNHIEGIAKNIHGSSTTTNQLFDVLIHEGGKKITGKWRSEVMGKNGQFLSGTFSFDLSTDELSFNGFYTIDGDDAVTTYYWNGSRN